MYFTDELFKMLFSTARPLVGMPPHASTHAAGVGSTKRPVGDYVPLATNDDAVVCQYVMTTLEELGLGEISDADLMSVADAAFRNERNMANEQAKVTKQKLVELMREA